MCYVLTGAGASRDRYRKNAAPGEPRAAFSVSGADYGVGTVAIVCRIRLAIW